MDLTLSRSVATLGSSLQERIRHEDPAERWRAQPIIVQDLSLIHI